MSRYVTACIAHVASMLSVQIGCGIASLRPIAEARQALKNVGFEILVDDDLAERELYEYMSDFV